ncbi:acyl-CoA thioesterase [Sporichthya polymorpha]|uniref:acyl-CoA thioesterase n=1 Tax=Sporichthya polymorpha TaxID=35751 RepID=UPI000376B828|nr:acyl-CoA thioesterase [Sporichthya polymorpha]
MPAHLVTVQIRWVDMDAYRHVNNTLYFRYCEQARIQMLGFEGSAEAEQRARTPDPEALPTDGFVLLSVDMEFQRPVVYRDTRAVDVQSWVTRIGNSSFDVAHRIVPVGEHGPDAKPFAACTSVMVAVDREAQRSRHLRPREIEMLRSYEDAALPVPQPGGRRGPQ